MNRSFWVALSLSVVIAAPAWADEAYLFACKNSWNQQVMVTVVTPTEKDARKLLKTPKYARDYSLCTLRGHHAPPPEIEPDYDEEEDIEGPDNDPAQEEN